MCKILKFFSGGSGFRPETAATRRRRPTLSATNRSTKKVIMRRFRMAVSRNSSAIPQKLRKSPRRMARNENFRVRYRLPLRFGISAGGVCLHQMRKSSPYFVQHQFLFAAQDDQVAGDVCGCRGDDKPVDAHEQDKAEPDQKVARIERIPHSGIDALGREDGRAVFGRFGIFSRQRSRCSERAGADQESPTASRRCRAPHRRFRRKRRTALRSTGRSIRRGSAPAAVFAAHARGGNGRWCIVLKASFIGRNVFGSFRGRFDPFH